MQTPLQIRFHGLEPSDAISEKIQNKVDKLEKVFHRITGCRVTVELPHNSKNKGNHYRISIEVDVPRETLIVNRTPNDRYDHNDPYVAIRDAFDSMERRLKNYADRIQPSQFTAHESPPVGTIAKLFPFEGYGFIATPEGREIYFNENSVVNDTFDHLQEGYEVRFAEELGEKGPQASSVTILSKAV